jgi:transcriptional/translational regulatory protein YebC/TACO1
MFKPKALVRVAKEGTPEDALIGDALDAGAEDVLTDDPDSYEIYGATADLDKLKEALAAKKYSVESAEAVMKPDNLVKVDEHNAAKVLKLVEMLEDHDDVQKVYANFDIPDQVLAKLGT